jgi:hypothetical protein
MTVLSPPASTLDVSLDWSLRWWDTDAECTLVVSQPSLEPDLWSRYGAGAEESYRSHGVECALDIEALRSGADTAMFMAVLDTNDDMLGGVRAIGPLTAPEDSHAVVEWAGQPGERAVTKMIADRVPYGVLEMKSAWVADDARGGNAVTDALARSGFSMMALLGVQFCMATAAAYVLNRWRSSGGVVAPIPAAAYPDHRYQTKMIWWDRCDFIRYAQPGQAAKIITESADLPRTDRALALR